MLNGAKIAKVAVVWTTIVYVVCVLFVWLFPDLSQILMDWFVHGNTTILMVSGVKIGSAIAGLILWDITVYLSVWLFVWLYNKMK